MSDRTERLSKWFYRGVWGALAEWFRVPRQPPTLPKLGSKAHDAFQPADGFLRYLKLQFWIVLVVIDALILFGWIAVAIAFPLAGLLLAPLALILAIVPDIIAYLAIHLRYDTTWYVLSDRSLRIRRGIWVIHETTITFENVQNVTVTQGPLQRFFGVSNVLVETAGGGGARSQHGRSGAQAAGSHVGVIEGVADAPRIRDLLLQRLRRSRSAGLGDEGLAAEKPSTAWTARHLRVLRDIRETICRIADAGSIAAMSESGDDAGKRRGERGST